MNEISRKTLFENVKELVYQTRARIYRQLNSELIQLNWQIGSMIVEDEQEGAPRAQYGKEILKNLSNQLTVEFGKGFDERNLNNMRAFYLAFSNPEELRPELSWTHYRILSRIETPEERIAYMNYAADSGWNTRDLERNIKTLYLKRKLPIPASNTPNINQFVKDPYILEFLNLKKNEKHLEHSIESALISHLQQFLMELGKGFAFVERQQHIVTDTSDFYIDLVFYNHHLKCFVLIDLKTEKLKHQHIGQMDMYVRMYDDLKKSNDDNPTIGLILCTEKDETIVKYSVLSENKKLFASKYRLYLPEEAELKQLIEADRQRLELDDQ